MGKWCHCLIPEGDPGAAGIVGLEITGVDSSLAVDTWGKHQESGQRHVPHQQLERAH